MVSFLIYQKVTIQVGNFNTQFDACRSNEGRFGGVKHSFLIFQLFEIIYI